MKKTGKGRAAPLACPVCVFAFAAFPARVRIHQNSPVTAYGRPGAAAEALARDRRLAFEAAESVSSAKNFE